VAQNLPGVDSQTFCANCGAKRLTIDGLKGEHTTLLVDGLPLHSSVAGFDGMDAIPLLGLEEILVARGSGAAGLAPESIAGTLNLISYRVHAPEFRLRTEASDRQNSLLAFRGGTPYGTGSLTLSGQEAYRGVWDIDHNGVAEVPERKMRSIHPLWVHHWSDRLRSQLLPLGSPITFSCRDRI
jgi:outer membrane receptor for ferrienterochelin and colicins